RLQRQRMDLADVLNQAVRAVGPLVEGRGHRLAMSLPTPPLAVEADAKRLAQVFTHLLDNAARHCEGKNQTSLTAAPEGDQAVGGVTDGGSGIEPSLLPHIFELFEPGRDVPDDAPGGLGIGLTLVRLLVELHGGTVKAASEGPGKGCEFVVRLPVAGTAP